MSEVWRACPPRPPSPSRGASYRKIKASALQYRDGQDIQYALCFGGRDVCGVKDYQPKLIFCTSCLVCRRILAVAALTEPLEQCRPSGATREGLRSKTFPVSCPRDVQCLHAKPNEEPSSPAPPYAFLRQSFATFWQFLVALLTLPMALTLAEAFSPHTMDTPFIMGVGGAMLFAIIKML